MSPETTLILGTILGLLFYLISTGVIIYILWLVIRALKKYLREDNKKMSDSK